MRIRVYQAYASNNSGSYTIVGLFADAETAMNLAKQIEDVSIAHHAWHEAHGWEHEGDSPLDAFTRLHELRSDRPGREDNWPSYGARPTAVAVAEQLFVHAPYTVTLSPVFGEFMYAKGGRVAIELDHAHSDIAATFPSGSTATTRTSRRCSRRSMPSKHA